MKAPVLGAEELERLLSAEFPGAFHPEHGFKILEVWHGGARVRRTFKDGALRPGGTVAGVRPVMRSRCTR